MRAIWKGAIAFGLVNVPVKVYSATEDHDISLHQVHNADGGRIRYQRRCEVCSKIVDYEDIDKAYEDDGRTVVLSRRGAQVASRPRTATRSTSCSSCRPSSSTRMMFEKSYYLEPDSKSPKAYVLLRRALEDTDRVAIVQFALRDKTGWAPCGSAVTCWCCRRCCGPTRCGRPASRRSKPAIRISAQEREMSAALVDSMAADFEPDQFTDDYQLQLRQLIEAKLEKGESLDTEETFGVPAAEAGSGEVIDLMEALKRSLEKKRGGGAASADEPAKSAAKPAARSTATSRRRRRPRRRRPPGPQPRQRPRPQARPPQPRPRPKTAAPKTAARSARKEA